MTLFKPAHARHFWKTVEPYWEHRDRPEGQRFLGSIRIERSATEQMLDAVGKHLQACQPISMHQLQENFGTLDLTWIKILTFALSEYAYYDDCEGGYWEGLCKRLGIRETQGATRALQQVIWKGTAELGLIRSNKANRYVSTLWLQSGISQQSLGHFADLIQSLDYDWWDLAHADPIDLSQLLCDVCEQRFPQRGRLLTFLKSSCAEEHEGEIDPISGILLQGLAIVAHELERRGESPEVLRDANQRARVLQDYLLPNTFFLRNWDSLINVLTPRKHTSRQAITSQRKKPLSLLLDITDSFDIQLVLPAHQIYRKEWKALHAAYCTIPEANWEGDISLGSGVLQTPELRQSITQAAQQWSWQLRSHTDAVLLEWHHAGIQPEQPYLIFDAETGELRSPQQIYLSPEVILFVPKDVQREYGDGIEVIDSFVPCSIRGWNGHLLQRTDRSAGIILRQGGHAFKLLWGQFTSQEPQLRGLRLKGRKPTFLGTPTIYYPPNPISKSINLVVEDLIKREPVTQPGEQLNLRASSSWQEVNLNQWIQSPGEYTVRLWSTNYHWTVTFEIQAPFCLSQQPPQQTLTITDRQRIPVDILPIRCLKNEDFWLEELTLKGIWPLERLVFRLNNGEEEVLISKNADSTGSALVALSFFRDSILETNQYSLQWVREGEEISLLSLNFNQELPIQPPNKLPITSPNGDSRPKKAVSASIPRGSTYWVNVSKKKSKIFQQKFFRELHNRGVNKFINIAYDGRTEYAIIDIVSSDYKTVLESICKSIEQEMYMQIILIER